VQIKELRVDGGVTKNEFMLQYQSDLLGVPVLRSGQVESTAWGVAALAGLTHGLIKDMRQLSQEWKSDFKATPTNDRSMEYEHWRSALEGAFSHARAMRAVTNGK
jgi:glycerol kinase